MKKISILFLMLLLLAVGEVYSQPGSGKKLLIVVTNSDRNLFGDSVGTFSPEVYFFCAVAYQYGFTLEDIDFLSPQGGAAALAPYNEDIEPDFPIPRAEKNRILERLKTTLAPEEVLPSNYNVIYYAGGYGCMNDFPTAENIGAVTAAIYENGGIVGAVSEGISGLLPVRLSNGDYFVKGKKLAANDMGPWDVFDLQADLANRGAEVIRIPPYRVVFERLVTASGYVVSAGNQPEYVAKEIMKLLGLNTAIKEQQTKAINALKVYPNPATNYLQVVAGYDNLNLPLHYALYDLTGRRLKGGLLSSEGRIAIDEIVSGHYVLEVLDQEASTFNTIIIKR